MLQCNLEKFRIFLEKDPEEFHKLIIENNEDLILNLICALKNSNISKIIAIIKEAEKNGNSNILDNLLQLEPFSNPIIEEFIKSGFLNELEFVERVDKVRKITSNLLNSLVEEKKFIRKNASTQISSINSSQKELELVLKEIQKYENELKILKDKKENDKKLKNLQKEINLIKKELQARNIKSLELELEKLKKQKAEIDSLKEEIEKSKNLFKNLPKDGA